MTDSISQIEEIEGRTRRRGELLQAFEDRAVANLVQAMPALETAVLEASNDNQEQFSARVNSIAEEFRLNDVQKALANDAFEKVQKDIDSLGEYGRTLTDGELSGSRNLGADIDRNTDLKRKFLIDIGFPEETLDENLLAKFSIDRDFPMALVIHFQGNNVEFAEAHGWERAINAQAHFVAEFDWGDEEEDKRKSDLLSGRVIFVTHPGRDEQRQLVRTAEQARDHEKRHYLYKTLKGWDNRDDFDGYVSETILDETQAELASGTTRITLNQVLQDKFLLNFEDTSPTVLEQHPEVASEMLDLIIEVYRLTNSKAIDNKVIANTILTSSDMNESVRRLKKLGDRPPDYQPDWFHILKARSDLGVSPGQEALIRKNNLYFMNLVTQKAIRANEASQGPGKLQAYSKTLAAFLDSEASIGISAVIGTHEDSKGVFEAIENQYKLLAGAGAITPELQKMFDNTKTRFESAKQDRARTKAWNDFLGFLGTERADLHQEYMAIRRDRSISGDFKARGFRNSKLLPIYNEWIKGKEEDYLR